MLKIVNKTIKNLKYALNLRKGFFLAVFATVFCGFCGNAFAATKLYLQDAITTNFGADDERTLTTAAGSLVVPYVKDSLSGFITPPTSATQFTKLSAGTVVTWYTEPLSAMNITGDVTFNIWAKESKSNVNGTITAELLRANSSGAIVSVIASVVLDRDELFTVMTLQNWAKTPISTDLIDGDMLALRIHIDDGLDVTMRSGSVVTVDIGGGTGGADGDSWVQITEALGLSAPPINSITGVDARWISADWQLVSGTTGYTLAASLGAANPPSIYASSATLGDLSAKVEAPSLSPNTTYYLFVKANGDGVSIYPVSSLLWFILLTL